MSGTVDLDQGRPPTYKESMAPNPPILELHRGWQISSPDFDVDFDETYQHDKWSERIIMSHALTHCAKTLEHYLETQAENPLDPILRIRGSHKSRFNPEGFRHVDFDLTMSLQDQLAHRGNMKTVADSRKTFRGTRTRADGMKGDVEAAGSAPSLHQWCRDFCAYRSDLKGKTAFH